MYDQMKTIVHSFGKESKNCSEVFMLIGDLIGKFEKDLMELFVIKQELLGSTFNRQR